MKRGITDQVASIRQRLVNLCRKEKEDFQYILTRYALERFLFRISASKYSDRFVLKGAMLFHIWVGKIHRPTKDLDLLSRGDNSAERLKSIFQDICKTRVESDGLSFDPASVSVSDIRDGQEYSGLRIKLLAKLGNARIPLQIDVGFGDAVTPNARKAKFPTLFDMPRPSIKIYPPETVIAEKLQTMVDLGIQNSRMKDIFDIIFLAKLFNFSGPTIVKAIQATFDRRKTALPQTTPVIFTNEFATDPQKAMQWKAFLSKNKLEDEDHFPTVIEKIQKFLLPPLEAAAKKRSFNHKWKDGGPWC